MTQPVRKIRIDAAAVPLPASVTDTVRREGKIVYLHRFPAAVRKVLVTKDPVLPSVWARKNRMMTLGRFAGLPWQGHLTPYLDGIMDAMAHPGVQEITVLKCVQSGGTETAHNFVGWSIEYLKYPVMYVFPDINTGRENAQDRIIAMIRESRALKKYFTGADDDVTKFRIKLSHMPIYVGWATSPARLANTPIGVMIFDETELYPDVAGKKHADPISEGEKRTITYGDARKIIYISVPSLDTGFITKKLNNAQAIFDYHVVCPICSGSQIMTFEQIKWPREQGPKEQESEARSQKSEDNPEPETRDLERGSHPDPDRIRAKKLARYECTSCQSKWDDRMRDKAVAAGQWIERTSSMELFVHLDAHRPITVGFHLPAWVSYFVSLSRSAAAWVEYVQSKDKNKLKDFLTKYAAEPWTVYEQKREHDAVLALCDDRPQGVVPGDDRVAALLMAIDTQDNGFWYEVRAFGWGLTEDSWQVRFGFVDSFSALEEILIHSIYQDPEGKPFVIRNAVIDTGGHRASQVVEFCRLMGAWVIPIKGAGRQAAPLRWHKQEFYPGTNKQIRGGIQRLDIDVKYYKDKLSGKLEIAPNDPGSWRMCTECTEEWARMMCAEIIDLKTNRWVPISESRPNHAWDVSSYMLALADQQGVRFWKHTQQGDGAGRSRRGKKKIIKKRSRW